VVADASMPVDAEADAEEEEDFRRFLERTSPAELIRHLRSSGAAEAEPDVDAEPGTGAQEPSGGEEGESGAPDAPDTP